MPTHLAQRPRRTPPHVPLGDLRSISGKTLDQVCEAASEILGKPLTRGALSGIENGHRGASHEVLAAIEIAYGLRPGAITTDYAPRARSIEAAS